MVFIQHVYIKQFEDLKLIHKDCPLFLKDIKDYIEKLENENI